jgi:predicted Zn-dependent protease
MLNNDLALRGSASVKSSNLIKFENAILNGDLHGKSTSATFLLENWTKSKGSPQGELEQMKQLLVESLLDRAQEDMNRFLRGKPTIGETEDYSGTVKDLRKASELLGYGHFMTKTLENRANFFEAMEIIRKGEINSYPKAESILISLEKAEPKSAFVQQGLAMLYVAKNNRDAAQATLMKAEQRIASWYKPLNTGAQLNIVAGKLDISLKQLSKAEELGSDKSDIYLLRSQMHLANFELREAEKTLQLLKNGSPGSYQTERALILGKIEELRGRISNAEKVYRDELGNKEINTAILLKLADLYRTQKDTLRSKEFYSKVLRVEPENVIAKGAMLAFGSGATSGLTINLYDPEEVVAHLNTLERTKKNEEALTVINKALEINNWNPEYYYQKGKFLYNLNRKTESVEALKKGISLSPYHFESLRAIVLILLEQKKNTEADAILKQHDKYFQNSAKWLLFEYNAYRQMNSKMDLLTILEKAIKMDSFDLEPYRALIMFHTENNEYKYAQNELLNLMAFGGNALDEELFLIRIDKQVKSEFAARDYFPLYDGIEILLKEDPLNLDYQYMGGMVAYMNMDYSKAELHLKELAKFQQTLSPAALLEYYKLKGKVLLETGKFEDAERVFQMYNQKAGNPSYLGLAMAQYELGKRESWIPNFQKDRDTTDFNDTAMKRIAKMAVKANK